MSRFGSAFIKITFLFILCLSHALAQTEKGREFVENKPYRLNYEDAVVNAQTSETVQDERLGSKHGITLKEGITEAIDGSRPEPDLTFNIKVPKAGQYLIQTYAVTDAEGAALMKKARTKFESLFMRIQIGEQRATKRVVYVPWDRPSQRTGVFNLREGAQDINIWLPRGVRLEFVELKTYVPPAVPPAALHYKPTVTPPLSHPRLWVTDATLPQVKANLTKDEHKEVWEKLKAEALTPFNFTFNAEEEMSFNAELESAAEKKAFYYLMTGDERIGREAVDLMVNYLSMVEFGNLLDITREMGRAIFIGSEVYDWTYPLLTAENKELLRKNLMRLADDMEIGWPPFRMKILNGHGNEAMVNRDLLAMSIALYNEDPLPYQYVSYAILEELVPMRKFEYQSPRHNQGLQYGAYRFGWEMHNAWLYKRMAGKEVFFENIKDLPEYWLYMRTPNGEMLRDGDGFSSGKPGQYYYWKSPLTMFLMYTYSSNPIMKGEFLRQGGLSGNPILFLLLNDPELKPEPSLESLPLTKSFGPILGSMVARTGWNVGPESDDVVAEIKGGGYHFGNHQHSDAGALQVYYRGFQLGDIGLYHFYGTPYDMGFNKRSISHSMMLVVDPDEEFGNRSKANDGGTRLNQVAPSSPEQVQSNPLFKNGSVVSADAGPDTDKPLFSYFSVDLASAYTDKVKEYVRDFCFLNLNRSDIPAAIILSDNMVSSNPEFKKYWQVNSVNPPEVTTNGFILKNEYRGRMGKTHVQFLEPTATERNIEVLSGDEAMSAFNMKFDAPQSSYAERTGSRTLVSPTQASTDDHFLTVLQVVDGETEPLPVRHEQTAVSEVVYLADRVVSMNKGRDLIDQGFELEVFSMDPSEVLLCGMKAGKWKIRHSIDNQEWTVEAIEGKNTISFQGKKGRYMISKQ